LRYKVRICIGGGTIVSSYDRDVQSKKTVCEAVRVLLADTVALRRARDVSSRKTCPRRVASVNGRWHPNQATQLDKIRHTLSPVTGLSVCEL
jgi:hypothetical protein